MARKTNKGGVGGTVGSNDNGYVKKNPSFCAQCGDEVTNAGRPSSDGKRFCVKPGCQAAKQRRHRQRAAALRPDRDAPTTCAGCGSELTQRAWRAGDDLGRYCRKVSCRRKRDRLRAEANLDRLPDALQRIELLENALLLVGDAVMADSEHVFAHNRVVCHRCGLTTALKGWVHLTEDGHGCQGTLDGQPVRRFAVEYLGSAWPFRREYANAETITRLESD